MIGLPSCPNGDSAATISTECARREMNHLCGRMISIGCARVRVQSQESVLTHSRYSVQAERQYPNTIRSAFTHQTVTYDVDAIFSSCNNRSTFITAKAVKGMWAELRGVLPRPPSKITSDQSPPFVVDCESLQRAITSVGSKFEILEVITFDSSEAPATPSVVACTSGATIGAVGYSS